MASIRQLRVAEQVAGELRSRILAAGDDPSFHLPPQDELVRDFGVSFPSVREAIRILETEGLVTVRRGNVGGLQVHRPNESSAAYHLGLSLQAGRVTIGDLAAGLQLLEPLCAGECARRADRAAAVVPLLAENVERCASLVGDGVAFTRAAREFHDLLVAGTPNATTRHVVGSLVRLWSAQESAWAESLARRGAYPSDTDTREALRAHQRIVDRVAAGRAADAERLARAHLVATQALFVDHFDDEVVDAAATKRS